ncbi:hypothetical protein B0I35DRAFT_279848 [Stachybotrys elegans]|uniref:Indole-diterpene biosynthesis protein PaxU n=1 Tax=Stachybotrys elegans TaxID=80388 RepID=A0A8K0SQ67_9HYPO|nr:hypothetical protein B0I35DRAFT_279848 [Stachybotrys elegans]
MAPAASSKGAKADPLSFMVKLSPCILVHRPAEDGIERTTHSPKLILLVPWMSAASSHIARYVRAYEANYPGSQILVIRNSLKHLLWKPSEPSPDVRPAIAVIRAAQNPDDPRPQVLVHMWSNGGSAMLSHLRAAYGDDFPPHVTIYDSGPGCYSYSRCVAAVMAGMPAWMYFITYPFVSVITILYWIWYFGGTNGFQRFYDSHNHVKGEVRRAYIYSESDKLVDYHDVDRHADHARQRGYSVRQERFTGTRHVAHIRGDEERYWKVIKETWQG